MRVVGLFELKMFKGLSKAMNVMHELPKDVRGQ